MLIWEENIANVCVNINYEFNQSIDLYTLYLNNYVLKAKCHLFGQKRFQVNIFKNKN